MATISMKVGEVISLAEKKLAEIRKKTLQIDLEVIEDHREQYLDMNVNKKWIFTRNVGIYEFITTEPRMVTKLFGVFGVAIVTLVVIAVYPLSMIYFIRKYRSRPDPDKPYDVATFLDKYYGGYQYREELDGANQYSGQVTDLEMLICLAENNDGTIMQISDKEAKRLGIC